MATASYITVHHRDAQSMQDTTRALFPDAEVTFWDGVMDLKLPGDAAETGALTQLRAGIAEFGPAAVAMVVADDGGSQQALYESWSPARLHTFDYAFDVSAEPAATTRLLGFLQDEFIVSGVCITENGLRVSAVVYGVTAFQTERVAEETFARVEQTLREHGLIDPDSCGREGSTSGTIDAAGCDADADDLTLAVSEQLGTGRAATVFIATWAD